MPDRFKKLKKKKSPDKNEQIIELSCHWIFKEVTDFIHTKKYNNFISFRNSFVLVSNYCKSQFL